METIQPPFRSSTGWPPSNSCLPNEVASHAADCPRKRSQACHPLREWPHVFCLREYPLKIAEEYAMKRLHHRADGGSPERCGDRRRVFLDRDNPASSGTRGFRSAHDLWRRLGANPGRSCSKASSITSSTSHVAAPLSAAVSADLGAVDGSVKRSSGRTPRASTHIRRLQPD